MKTLITGCLGYIGLHLAKRLKDEGHYVVGVDDRSHCDQRYLKSVPLYFDEFYECNFTKSPLYDYDCVYHLAAHISVAESETQAEKYIKNNVVDWFDFITQIQFETKTKKVVFASSAAVYGEYNAPILETFAKNPINTYGLSKEGGESLLNIENYKFKKVIFRFFNVAGVNPEVGYCGENQHLIRKSVLHALQNKEMPLYGDTYRDYVHVDDVVELLVSALETEIEGTFNVGRGIAINSKEVIQNCFQSLGRAAIIKEMPARDFEPRYLVTYCNKMCLAFNFYPTKDINDIIDSTIQWEMKNR